MQPSRSWRLPSLLLFPLAVLCEPPSGCDEVGLCSAGTSEDYDHGKFGRIRFRRDGQQICVASLPAEPASGSVPHDAPLSRGGTTAWSSLRCAHLDESVPWHPEFTLYDDLMAPMLGACVATADVGALRGCYGPPPVRTLLPQCSIRYMKYIYTSSQFPARTSNAGTAAQASRAGRTTALTRGRSCAASTKRCTRWRRRAAPPHQRTGARHGSPWSRPQTTTVRAARCGCTRGMRSDGRCTPCSSARRGRTSRTSARWRPRTSCAWCDAHTRELARSRMRAAPRAMR
jgi:hypothetical protein